MAGADAPYKGEYTMSVGIGTISKGLVQLAIEKVSNDKDQREEFLQVLTANNPTSDWIKYLGDKGGLPGNAEEYFRTEWLHFWSDSFPVEAIVRQSLIQAIELAERRSETEGHFVALDCYWLWTNDQSRFEVLITVNARQVTRIVLTPPPPTAPNNPREPLNSQTEFYIVKPASPVEEEVNRDEHGQWRIVRLRAP